MKICQGCKQPILNAPHLAFPGPSGATWYLHLAVTDCVRALWAAARVRRAA